MPLCAIVSAFESKNDKMKQRLTLKIIKIPEYQMGNMPACKYMKILQCVVE